VIEQVKYRSTVLRQDFISGSGCGYWSRSPIPRRPKTVSKSIHNLLNNRADWQTNRQTPKKHDVVADTASVDKYWFSESCFQPSVYNYYGVTLDVKYVCYALVLSDLGGRKRDWNSTAIVHHCRCTLELFPFEQSKFVIDKLQLVITNFSVTAATLTPVTTMQIISRNVQSPDVDELQRGP